MAWSWAHFSKGQKAACQKQRERLLTGHSKQKVLSHPCQCAREGIFTLLLGITPLETCLLINRYHFTLQSL